MPEARRLVCPNCAAINRLPDGRSPLAAHCGSCHRPLFEGQPTEVDEAGLERHLTGGDLPVLLDIWAAWCGPCRTMAPMFHRAAAMLEPDVRLLKLDADAAPTACARLGVRGIPALYLLQGNRVLAQTAGALDTNRIVQWARDRLQPAPG